MSIESWAAIRSAHPPARRWPPRRALRDPSAPSVKLQHRLSSPRWQAGQGGSMPRGPQVSHGLSSTRWPTSRPCASGPSDTTSATTSWPGTWGIEEKAAIGLSMSPDSNSPSTSLVSEPHTPVRRGRVTTQSGRTGAASSTWWSPKGRASIRRSSSSPVPSRASAGSRGIPNTSALISRLPGTSRRRPVSGHRPAPENRQPDCPSRPCPPAGCPPAGCPPAAACPPSWGSPASCPGGHRVRRHRARAVIGAHLAAATRPGPPPTGRPVRRGSRWGRSRPR